MRDQSGKPRWRNGRRHRRRGRSESGKRPMRSLVSAGLRLSKYGPVAGATHSPPMKFLKVLAIDVRGIFRHQGAGAGELPARAPAPRGTTRRRLGRVADPRHTSRAPRHRPGRRRGARSGARAPRRRANVDGARRARENGTAARRDRPEELQPAGLPVGPEREGGREQHRRAPPRTRSSPPTAPARARDGATRGARRGRARRAAGPGPPRAAGVPALAMTRRSSASSLSQSRGCRSACSRFRP